MNTKTPEALAVLLWSIENHEHFFGVGTCDGKKLHKACSALTNLVEAHKQVLASLVASVSLLERGGKKAAASDRIFDLMLNDYHTAIDSGRAALAAAEELK